jgi:ketosteroid isomerase-like protein
MRRLDEDAPSAVAAAVAEAERKLAAAHLSLDLETIDRLLHPDYVILQPGGRIETKADVLASYRAGGRRWDTAEADELDIRLLGGTAIVAGRWQASGENQGEPFDYAARFLSVWFREDGRWRNIAYMATELNASW